MGAFQRFLLGMISPVQPREILDAGCGEGYFSALMRERFPDARITGIDASSGAVGYASASFGKGIAFLEGDLFALPFADDSFDVVVCSEVLEHLDEPDRAFAELKRVARKRVVLTVPLEPWFKFFNDIARALRIADDPGHVQFWSHSAFQEFVTGLHPGATFGKVHYYQGAVCDLES